MHMPNAFSVDPRVMFDPKVVAKASNLGLKLANAFGVISRSVHNSQAADL